MDIIRQRRPIFNWIGTTSSPRRQKVSHVMQRVKPLLPSVTPLPMLPTHQSEKRRRNKNAKVSTSGAHCPHPKPIVIPPAPGLRHAG